VGAVQPSLSESINVLFNAHVCGGQWDEGAFQALQREKEREDKEERERRRQQQRDILLIGTS